MIYKYDISVTKNYLKEKEIKILNNLTELFLITIQNEAKEQRLMTMKDWINVTDDLLKYRKKEVLKCKKTKYNIIKNIVFINLVC